MENALIVSRTQKSLGNLSQMLEMAGIHQATTSSSCAQARQLMLERDFDIVIINAPLGDETGEHFSRQTAAGGTCQVILIVAAEHFDAICAVCESDGVLTVSKPINKDVFWSALRFASSAWARLSRMRDENSALRRKIDEIRLVDRAKCTLISRWQLSEQEAHKHIEKRAMDTRATKVEIAREILATHES